jgi:hypothetical protein
MYSFYLAMTAWVSMVAATALLLRERMQLGHRLGRYDQLLVRTSLHHQNTLHDALEHRIARLDYWGMSLTAAIAIYALALFIYPLYQQLESILHSLLQLVSVF